MERLPSSVPQTRDCFQSPDLFLTISRPEIPKTVKAFLISLVNITSLKGKGAGIHGLGEDEPIDLLAA